MPLPESKAAEEIAALIRTSILGKKKDQAVAAGQLRKLDDHQVDGVLLEMLKGDSSARMIATAVLIERNPHRDPRPLVDAHRAAEGVPQQEPGLEPDAWEV